MKKISFAIIGCGRIAQRHARYISVKGELTAVCDIVKERADEMARFHKVKAYYSLDDLLQQEKTTDVIVICTPNGLHAEQTVLALQAGYHVLCEKPMALTVQDCEGMISAAKKKQKELFIVKQNRFNPPVAVLKKIIDEGRLGKIYSIQLNCFWNRDAAYYENSWKGTRDLDGGTLYTQFSHFIDLIIWLVGDVKQVKPVLVNYAHKEIIDFEDTGAVILEFNNGAIGTLHYTVNTFQKNMEGSLTIFAEKGTVKIGGQYLNTLEYQAIKNFTIENIPVGNEANDYGTYQGSMSNHDKVYDNLIAVLNDKAVSVAQPIDGLKTVALIEKIYREAVRI